MTRTVPIRLLGLISFLAFALPHSPHLPAQPPSAAESARTAEDAGDQGTTEEIAKLVEQLGSGDLQTRRDAAWKLGEFGRSAAPAVSALANATSDRDPQVSNGALQSLGRIGPAAQEALPAVVEQLRQGNAQHRYRAAFALGHIAEADHEAFGQGLQSDSEPLRVATAVAVGWLGADGKRWSTELVQLLSTENEEDFQQVLIALGRLGQSAVSALRESLASDESSALQLARCCAALEQLGTKGNVAAEDLTRLISNKQIDVKTRAAALQALAAVAPGSPETNEQLKQALSDDATPLRHAALRAVIAEPTLAIALQTEIVTLLDADSESANLAALAMGRIGKEAVPIVPDLLTRLRLGNTNSIINTVSKIGPLAIPAILDSAAKDEITVAQAVQIIQRMGPVAEGSLMTATKSQTAERRAVAYQSLGELDLRHDEVVSGLDDPKASVRAAAARGLSASSRVMAEAIPRLKELATDRNSDVRVASLGALIAWNVAPNELIAPLQAALTDPSSSVRASSAEVLGQLSEMPAPLVRSLAASLQDDQPEVRLAAATTLASTPQDIRAAIPELIDATQDESVQVVNQAARALGNIEQLPPEGLDAVAGLLRHDQVAIKEAALSALSRIGAAALPYRQQLEELTHDESSSLRVGSVKALVQILPENQAKLALLVEALDDPEWGVRRQIMETLADLGEDAVPAVPRLLELMRHRDDAEAATSALRRIDDAPPEAVPLLIEVLSDDQADRRHRYYALHLLRKVGPAAGEALPMLREMRDSSEGRMRDFLDRTIRDVEEAVSEETDRGA